MKKATPSAAVVPASIIEDAWQAVGAGFERFCLTTEVATVTDSLTPTERSERMRRVRGKDTKPEMRVRRLVHGMGFRYRLHARELPGCPDMVFRGKKHAIFIHGCFWHRHPGCKLTRMPKSRLEFWRPKLEGNRRRDLRNQRALADIGWRVLIVWECETKDHGAVERRIRSFLSGEGSIEGHDDRR